MLSTTTCTEPAAPGEMLCFTNVDQNQNIQYNSQVSQEQTAYSKCKSDQQMYPNTAQNGQYDLSRVFHDNSSHVFPDNTSHSLAH